jgi:hypothetical protein
MKGVDFGMGRIKGDIIKKAGFDFVCRYLSHNPAKNLSKSELEDFRSADLKTVVVWETTTSRPLSGRPAGIADATTALDLAKSLSSDISVIYFACDDDYKEKDLDIAKTYFQGIATILEVDNIGVYGGYNTVKYMLDNNLCRYAWQTYAWSHGRWDNRAQLRQTNIYGPKIAGVDCDTDESMTDDFGQF